MAQPTHATANGVPQAGPRVANMHIDRDGFLTVREPSDGMKTVVLRPSNDEPGYYPFHLSGLVGSDVLSSFHVTAGSHGGISLCSYTDSLVIAHIEAGETTLVPFPGSGFPTLQCHPSCLRMVVTNPSPDFKVVCNGFQLPDEDRRRLARYRYGHENSGDGCRLRDVSGRTWIVIGADDHGHGVNALGLLTTGATRARS